MHQEALADEAAYDLFRQAIVDRSEVAWQILYERYYPMLLSWAYQWCARSVGDEFAEDIAAIAFMRAWRALYPQQFSQFETTSSLLAYLRHCVTTAVLDCHRSRAQRERLINSAVPAEPPTPEQQVLKASLSAELWAVIDELDLSPVERTLLVATVVYGLPPREILHSYQHLFASVQQVYAIKRNLFARLARCEKLKALYADFTE